MKIFARVNVCLLLLSLLPACGFHLRGKQDMSPLLARVSINNQLSDAVLSGVVEQELAELGYVAVPEDQSHVVLSLKQAHYEKRVLSIGALGKAQEFEVGYSLTYSLNQTGVKTMLVQDTLKLKRDMSYEVSQALGKSKEEHVIKRELLHEAARHIVRRIQYLSPDKLQTVPD